MTLYCKLLVFCLLCCFSCYPLCTFRLSAHIFGLILLLCGGGYEAADGTKLATDGLPGIIKTIDEYLSHRQERELKSDIFTTYKDSLQIKDPEDILLLLKQVSENKDVAK